MFGPATPIKHSLSSPVHSSACHSNICFAGGLPINLQKSWKLSLAFNTSSLGGLTVTLVAVIRAIRLYANDALDIAIS